MACELFIFYTQISELSLTPPSLKKFLGSNLSFFAGSNPRKLCQKSYGRPADGPGGVWGAWDVRFGEFSFPTFRGGSNKIIEVKH